jgi:hypothetical protein
MSNDDNPLSPDARSTALANKISAQVINNVLSDRPSLSDVITSFPMWDVAGNMDVLSLWLSASSRLDGRIPCMRSDGQNWLPYVPALSELRDGRLRAFQFPGATRGVVFRRLFAEFVEGEFRGVPKVEASEQEGYRFRLCKSTDVMATVDNLLSSFLSYRIWAYASSFWRVHLWPRPSTSPIGAPQVNYLNVTVSTVNPGLRIFSSPVYFITWTYFGAPTTPVSGPLLPGRYLFSGQGSLVPIFTCDPAQFNIPPTLNPVLSAI